MSKDSQVIIFPLDQVLEAVTFQLHLDFHPKFSYLKLNVLTCYQQGFLLGCLMSLCFKYQLNLLRQSKVIDLLVQGMKFGY